MADRDAEIQHMLADVARQGSPQFDPAEAEVFARGLQTLKDAGVPFLVAGAFAKHAYTGVWRDTKDIDVFLKPADVKAAMTAMEKAGYKTNVQFHQWLAKARQDPYVIDMIFGLGNGQLPVDDQWFGYSQPYEIVGVPVRLIPIEELIVSKAYIAERYRCDVADILHLIQQSKGRIDWSRVLERLGDNWELLLWHLVLFDYVFPGHADYLPQDLMAQFFERAQQRWSTPEHPKAFRGTLLDPFSFVIDIEDRGYQDRRNLRPLVDDSGNLL